MKKIVLSLAGALAATAFAPEASAIPAFARQTGMACTACHAQHFPILNSFGRAFKAAGYTMMGAQGKVEGEHLSLPETLNASIVMKIRYQDNNQAGPVGPSDAVRQNVGGGQLQFFDEFALLFGGRIADNVGFILEGQMMNTGPLAASFRMPFVYDVGGAKLSVIPFTTDAFSAAYGYELSSGGIMRANRWAEHRAETSAVQWLANSGDGATAGLGAATGFAFVAQNDMGWINVTKFNTSSMPGGGNSDKGAGGDLDSTYVRIAATPTLGGWATVIGLGKASGSSFSNAAMAGTATAPGKIDTDQTFFDFQAQGEVAGKELGVYFQHAKAPAGQGVRNAYNTSVCVAGTVCNPDRKATTIGADYSVIPHVLSVGAAYAQRDTGGAAATNGSDAWTITGVYDLYQNVALHINYSNYSGSAHNAANAVKNLTTFMLEASW